MNYKSIYFRIGREEGVRKLYSGYKIVHLFFCIQNFLLNIYFLFSVSAALLRQATYGTIKIGIYQKLKRIFADDIQRLYLK